MSTERETEQPCPECGGDKRIVDYSPSSDERPCPTCTEPAPAPSLPEPVAYIPASRLDALHSNGRQVGIRCILFRVPKSKGHKFVPLYAEPPRKPEPGVDFPDEDYQEVGYPSHTAQPAPAAGDTTDVFKQRDGESAWEFQKRQRETVAALTADLAAARADNQKLKVEIADLQKHELLASGYHKRTEREVEISAVLDEIPEGDRDSADCTIAELLDLVDAGRNRVLVAEDKAAALRGALQRIKNEVNGYPEARDCLHAIEDIADAALTGSTGSAGAGWLPIESAPKDREVILCRVAHGEEPVVTEGYWQEESEEKASEFHATGAYLGEFGTGEVHPAFWMSAHGGFSEEYPPTHWRDKPLPPPPAAEGGGL